MAASAPAIAETPAPAAASAPALAFELLVDSLDARGDAQAMLVEVGAELERASAGSAFWSLAGASARLIRVAELRRTTSRRVQSAQLAQQGVIVLGRVTPPPTGEAWVAYLRGWAALVRGDAGAALRSFDDASKLRPDFVAADCRFAEAVAGALGNAKALDLCDALAKRWPARWEVWRVSADVAALADDDEEAARCIDRAISLRPDALPLVHRRAALAVRSAAVDPTARKLAHARTACSALQAALQAATLREDDLADWRAVAAALGERLRLAAGG